VSTRTPTRRRVPSRARTARVGLLLAAAAGVLVTAGCQGAPHRTVVHGQYVALRNGMTSAAVQPGGSATNASAVPRIVVTPANRATGVDPSAPVTVTVIGGQIESVRLIPTSQAASDTAPSLAGQLNTGGTTWSSGIAHLAVSTAYTVAVTALGPTGVANQLTSAFTTLTPTNTLGVQQTLPADGSVVGVGQPVMVEFDTVVPPAYRAGVERAMTVTTEPRVAGAWSWVPQPYSTYSRVDWRPQSYWKPGTSVHVHLALNGVPVGGGRYGTQQQDFSFTIGSDVRAVVDTEAHQMTVYQDGRTLRTVPTDTGKAGYSTWGGVMVVLDKSPTVEMTSCSVSISCDPSSALYYDLMVHWDVHLTDSGTYVHAAPWDSAIGEDNTSHGCIHLTNDDAEWFYGVVKPGDVVQVNGEPQNVDEGNGFGDWNLSWSQWLANSAAGVTG
jgi:lipoprotein-anchoring transpeptidase ErfK/SrfK